MSFRGPSRDYSPSNLENEYLVGAIERMARQRPQGGGGGIGTGLAGIQAQERMQRERLRAAEDAERRGGEAMRDQQTQQMNAQSIAQMDATMGQNYERMLADENRKAGVGGPTESDLRRRLAEYVKSPSRSAAAAAIEAGAALNNFPDRFAGEPGYEAPRGTPEYYRSVEEELRFQRDMQERYGAPAQPKGNYQTKVGANGNFYVFDPATGRMQDTGIPAGQQGGGSVPYGGAGAAGGMDPAAADSTAAEPWEMTGARRSPYQVTPEFEQQAAAEWEMTEAGVQEQQRQQIAALVAEMRRAKMNDEQIQSQLRQMGIIQ